MDGQTDDQYLDIKLAIPISNALPICIIYFFDLLINAGKTLLRHETVLYKLKMLGLNNILFIQISPTQHVHITFIEDLNESILLIEFISSCKKFTPLILYIVTA